MSTPFPVETLTLQFQLPLFPRQLPQWRGAFCAMAGAGASALLHNHQDAGLHYRYPLVQYRVQEGRAAIFALNEGIAAVQQALLVGGWACTWQGQPQRLIMTTAPALAQQAIVVGGPARSYRIHHYLPFNQDNYQEWQRRERLAERSALLEKLLRNHLLSALWGLGWNAPTPLEVTLTDLRKTQVLRYHRVGVMAFNLDFRVNALLPDGLALGKAVSHGFGQLWGVETKKSQRQPVVEQRAAQPPVVEG